MGEYMAYENKRRRTYDVALVISTPRGKRIYEFGNSYRTMKQAMQAAEIFNREVGVIA